jgi:acyl-CoA reductase-like NAD-dependent aldehyde dehydrogenase
VVKGLKFGLRLNDGQTCIAPRRVFVAEALAEALESRLADAARELPLCHPEPSVAARARELAREAVEQGARLVAGDVEDRGEFSPLIVAGASPEMRLLQEDVFAPVLSIVVVRDDEEALAAASRCPLALGASVFGRRAAARGLARRARAGSVVVNDLIAPTADARFPFGGRGRSGFGVTRGAEGLLEMTTLKAVATPRGWWRLHLDEPGPEVEKLIGAYLVAAHAGSYGSRVKGWLGVVRAARSLWKARRTKP